MSRVFVPNQPTTYDDGKGTLVRKVDLTPAAAFGPLVFLTPDGEMQGEPAEVVARMIELLDGFTGDDYLLLAGDPRTIAWAAAIAADRADGQLKLLHWNRRAKRYQVVAVPLWDEEKPDYDEAPDDGGE